MAGDWFDEQGAPGPAPGGGGGGGDDWFTQQGGAGGAPPSAPSSAPASAPGGGGVDRTAIQAFIAQWQQSHAPSEGIGPLADAIARQFPGVTRHMYGNTPSNNELSINGEKYKVIGGEDSPTSAYWYIPGTDDSPGFGGGGGRGGGGYYYDPAPNEEDYDAGYGHRLGYGGGLEMDPGYQFRLSEGAKALEHSAAAKGTLLTGGTLKGLARYAQDYASGEFQNRYNRLFGEQQNRYNQLSGLAGLGANAAAQQGGANTGYAGGASDLLTQQGNARAAGTVAQNQTSQNAINQGLNMAQLYWLSRLGQGGSGGGAGGNPTYTPGSGQPLWR